MTHEGAEEKERFICEIEVEKRGYERGKGKKAMVHLLISFRCFFSLSSVILHLVQPKEAEHAGRVTTR